MKGLFYEEMEPGMVIRHPLTRTVTEMDNVLFCALTMNVQPLHLDVEYASTLPYGRPLVNSLFTVGLIGGMIVPDLLFQTSLGNLGYEHIEFPKPVYAGDTLRAETTVLDRRESKSDASRGIVWFEHRGFNQRDELVMLCKRVGMIMRTPPGDA